MEASNQKSKLNQMLLELFVISIELHPVLQACNLDIHGGLLFLIENDKELKHLQCYLKNHGITVTQLNRMSPLPASAEGVFISNYKKHMKEEQIYRYLESQSRAIPVMVSRMILPPCLENFQSIVPLFEFDLAFDISDSQVMLTDFIKYVRSQPKWMCQTINHFCTSKLFEELDSISTLIIAFKTAAYLYAQFYRLNHTEDESIIFFKKYMREIISLEKMTDTYACDIDVLSTLQKIIKQSAFNNPAIIIADKENINSKAFQGLQQDRTIVFDNCFYYIPEAMLKNICEPLTDVISFLNIKKYLHKEGILAANDTHSGGYTVKQVFNCSYGVSSRPRILKIKKSFLFSLNEANLEEKGGN